MPKHSARGVCFDDLRKNPNDRKVLLVFEPVKFGAFQSRNPQWRLPGGKCCSNRGVEICCLERDTDTVVRKIMDETGILTWVVIFLSKVERQEYFQGLYNNFTHYQKYFLVRMIRGQLKPKKKWGVKTPAWFPVTALPDNLSDYHRNLIWRVIHMEENISRRAQAIKDFADK